MALTFRNLHPVFVGEASSIELRAVHDEETLGEIRAGMDKYAVLVFRDQPFEDAEQLAFAERLDGKLHEGTGSRVIAKNRFGNEALSDISNVNAEGEIMKVDDRRRHYTLGNRLWHPDASFRDPAGRYSMLHARVVPPVAADTEFADMRAAYDTLPAETKALIEGLRTHHSIAHSRQVIGFDFSQSEQDQLKGAVHPLVRTIPRSLRRSLYLASHQTRILDWPLPEGRLLLRDLTEHATQREFVYRHAWRIGDLVIWDNRATMHRARPFDDTKYRRELRRVTTLDIAEPALVAAGSSPARSGPTCRAPSWRTPRRRPPRRSWCRAAIASPAPRAARGSAPAAGTHRGSPRTRRSPRTVRSAWKATRPRRATCSCRSRRRSCSTPGTPAACAGRARTTSR